MAEQAAADKAKEVKIVVERIYHALLRAHRRIYRATVRSQADIGTGHPTAADERETSLGQRLYTDSYADLVVLGFWYRGLKSPKYVCSTSATNIIRAVREVSKKSMAVANSWRTKDRAGVYHEFLREAKRMEPDVQEINVESRQMTNRHELDMARMQRTLGVSFHTSEAEARMASYLMQHDVTEMVHLYCTDSPCGYCSRTFAALEPAIEKAEQRMRTIQANRPAHKRELKQGDPGQRLRGLGWQIGWIFYGQPYHASDQQKTTDLHALDKAVRAESIEGYRQI